MKRSISLAALFLCCLACVFAQTRGISAQKLKNLEPEMHDLKGHKSPVSSYSGYGTYRIEVY